MSGSLNLTVQVLIDDIVPGTTGTTDEERPEEELQVDGQDPSRWNNGVADRGCQHGPEEAGKVEVEDGERLIYARELCIGSPPPDRNPG